MPFFKQKITKYLRFSSFEFKKLLKFKKIEKKIKILTKTLRNEHETN